MNADDTTEHCPTSIGELVKAGLGMWECPPGAILFLGSNGRSAPSIHQLNV